MRNSLRSSFAVSFLLFLSLVAWSVSSPIGSGVDADFHLGSIWCARGEVKGLCESIDMAAQPQPTARVPFMFQMCNDRNIYFFPYCEVVNENPSTQLIRMAHSDQQSLYYWTAHLFAGSDVNRSVVFIRLFNSLLVALTLFALLALSANRLRKAVVISWTLTLIPNGIQLLSGINPRSWAVLGIMSSWAFLYGFLTEDTVNRLRRRWQLGCYVGAVALAASSRFDALLYVLSTSAIVLCAHFIDFNKLSIKRIAQLSGTLIVTVFALKLIPRLKSVFSFGVPEPFGSAQYLVFQLVHIPEFVADWWGYSIGQQGSGPGVIGLVGVILFAVYMYALLRSADRCQLFAVICLSLFIFLALFRATTAAAHFIPLTGVYTFGLIAPLIGLTALYSKTEPAKLLSTGMTSFTVIAVALMHALTFYHWMEFFTRRGVNVQFYETFSLADSWWWNSSVSPNWVFFFGSIAFSAFLCSAWKKVKDGSLSEPGYR
jgi:hypothetical protein